MELDKESRAFQEKLPERNHCFTDKYSKYRKELENMLDKQAKSLRREKWITGPMWIYIVILCTAFLLIGGFSQDPTTKLWLGLMACFWFIFGSVFLFRYFMNRDRLELIKEIKELRLIIMDIQDKLEQDSDKHES